MTVDTLERSGRFIVTFLVPVLLGGLGAPAVEIAGETLASETLQHDTQLELFMQDWLRESGCANGNRKVIKTEVKTRPAATASSNGDAPGAWSERWYIDRCGEVVAWDIRFTPAGREIGRQFAFVKDFHDPARAPVTLDGKLYAAAESGDADRVRELIAQGAKADSVSDKGVPALVAAAGEGHAAAVKALLEGGADVTMSREEVKETRALENIHGGMPLGMPERLLHMRVHVIDVKDDALRAFAGEGPGLAGEIQTGLMNATDKADWAYHPPPLVPPRSVP